MNFESVDFSRSSESPEPSPATAPETISLPADVYLSIDDVQRQLKRSRASVYRYANTDADLLNPPFDPQKLNPEIRDDRDDPLQFHPQEVRRFARDVLGLSPTIAVQPSEETVTQTLLKAVLQELQAIRRLLENPPPAE